jgi:IPT/TIG domain
MPSRSLFPVVPALLVLFASLFALGASACGSDNTKLLVTGIEPDRGDTDGDTYVRIKGNRFMADGPRTAKIYFGGRPGRVVRFESDAELVVQPPGGKAGEVVDVLIMFDPGGTLKIPNGFRYYERNRTAPTVDDLNITRGKDTKK